MAYIEIICALIITGFFLFGFSQAFIPAYKAWEKAIKTYQTVHTISFIAESFKKECSRNDRNIDRWKHSISAAKEMEHYEIKELWQDSVLRAIKLTCLISGEKIEVIGECMP